MPALMWSDETVGSALSRFGNYRVERTQTVANEGEPDGLAGRHILAIGLRETALQNIEGGLKRLPGGVWMPLDPTNPSDAAVMDIGCFQISRRYHSAELAAMPNGAVAAGTWKPIVTGMTPADPGYVPTFEDSLQFTIEGLQDAQDYGRLKGVPASELPRFSIAAHNAGMGGALQGWREGNVDKYTAMGDYSGWVLKTADQVLKWLKAHPNWYIPSV